MGVNEYVLGLMAILSGLAVTDMVSSLHGLLRRVRAVRWDFLPLSAAALVFLSVLNSWFVAWYASGWPGAPFWQFLITIGQLITLFLAAKAVLPDDDGTEEKVILIEHYKKQNRYVWLALCMTCLLTVVHNASVGARYGVLADFLFSSYPYMIFVGILLSLVLVQKMLWHRIAVPSFLLLVVVLWHGRVLTGTV